jgi:predicted nucleotidyltransferase
VKVEEAKETATAIACELKERFSANRVMLFVSLARDDFHEWSDIDLAVWGVAPTEYFRAVAFASGFSKVFKVDLVDAQDCSESLLQHVLKEGVEL